ncbi:metallophosphoesterase family protein [Sandaracinobacter sp. RS1-74]|uniref:purple acid phosphatase family protein n=1 Tax=Sandaracinobacteroides sayramensis TaxID=2913411 RepID=UPI001EDA9042|nr:metallophosphoesterase family protein [Sandaracinobacteroides sayramensis]MCG2842746.1 metallophosphoesterase family protein [Sandaracinobacteroides sayramensis]
MRTALLVSALLLAAPAIAQAPAVIDMTGEKAPAAAGAPYRAKSLPDRVVLNPGADPAREMAVTWRTETGVAGTQAELAEMAPSPTFGQKAVQVSGTSVAATSENGPSRHHSVRFIGLKPDTAYAYRVQGTAGWSEWHQFRTASAEAKPFRFLYVGDTQNSILNIGSLAWRRALLQAGNPALMLHAGDLVASRDDLAHDDEWGEWFAAGGWALASVPQVVAAGNHEYVDLILPNGAESRRLAPHWPVSFTLPKNGAAGAEATSYFLDWQGVRFVVLDGTSALDLGTLKAQTDWLDRTLAGSKARWNVVLMHQPIFTCARPKDTPKLKEAWAALFERRKVDLVLQGHDHCYSRLTAEQGREAGAKARTGGAVQGPVYMVSVAGSKMYGLNDRSASQPDKVAEDSSLFQIVDVEADRLKLRAHLNTGVLYDGFDLVKGADGRNRLVELDSALPQARRCSGPAQLPDQPMPAGRLGPDGLPCTAEVKD